MITLVTGGVKSGKSSHVLRLSGAYRKKIFVATSEYYDKETEKRIELHRAERDASYETREVPLELSRAFSEISNNRDTCVIIDCLTTWVGNLIHHEKDLQNYTEAFTRALQMIQVDAFIVTNEVGLGVIGPTVETRYYINELGKLNQKVAGIAHSVLFMVSGLPMVLK